MRYVKSLGRARGVNAEQPELGRLTPAMSSRKLQARDFIYRYFARWGYSPTLGEIAGELGVSRKYAYDLVHQLATEKMIEVVAGKARGIRLIDRGEELSEADVLFRLLGLGWTVGQGDHVLIPPAAPITAGGVTHAVLRALTTNGLSGLTVLDFDPDDRGTAGMGIDGEREESRASCEVESRQALRHSAVARQPRRRPPGRLGAAPS
jgi:hypothetical protein